MSDDVVYAEDFLAQGKILLTAEQAVAAIGCSRATLVAWANNGQIKPLRDRNGRVFYHPDEVETARRHHARKYEGRQEKALAQRTPLMIDRSQAATYGKVQDQLPPARHAVIFPPMPARRVTHVGERPEKKTGSRSKDPIVGYSGHDAAKATTCFNEGKSPREVQVLLNLRFDVIKHFYEEWKGLDDQIFVVESKLLSVLRGRFDWNEEVPTQDGFFKALTAYIEREVGQRLEQLATPAGGKTPLLTTPPGSTAVQASPGAQFQPLGLSEPIPESERALVEKAMREAEEAEAAESAMSQAEGISSPDSAPSVT